MENEKLLLTATAVSVHDEQSMARNDVFMLLKFRLVDTLPNLNRQGVTKQFIDDMISRRDQLIGLPLYCDVQRLLNHDYEHLGHMLDEDGMFHSTQIGSLIDFELATEGGVSAIITTARVPKREASICQCLMQLYEMDALKFSFQISYNPGCTVQQDGVLYVDGSPDNSLTGVAVVSIPANPNSYALQMVAEKNAEADEGVENVMNEEQVKAMIAEAVAAKEQEMAKAIAEKDAIIAERDAQIAELNQAVAAKEEEKPENEEVVAEAAQEEKPENEEATAEEKKELPWEKNEEEKDEEDATAEKKDDACAEVDSLKAELARVQAELDTMKQEKMAAELEANRAVAKSFAEKQGLDVADEAVSKAIAELDYKMIAELSMKIEKPVAEEAEVIVASIAGDGFEMRGNKWEDLLAPRK